jgi:arylamine N-acetyltransferase
MRSVFDTYLKLLDVSRQLPSLEYLTELTTAHITNIPFENISKLYYYHAKGLKYIPDIDLYLSGIKNNNFGGTCYSNNYHFNQLLNHLGFEAWLCGADMSAPDVHLTNIVVINDNKYLVDVGYAAPFYTPVPIDIKKPYSINHGSDFYKFFPLNKNGFIELKQYRDNKLKHGYIVKPIKRLIEDFEGVIKDSFRESATFLNRITIVKFYKGSSISLRNYSLIKITDSKPNKINLIGRQDIVDTIEINFKMPREIIENALSFIRNLD